MLPSALSCCPLQLSFTLHKLSCCPLQLFLALYKLSCCPLLYHVAFCSFPSHYINYHVALCSFFWHCINYHVALCFIMLPSTASLGLVICLPSDCLLVSPTASWPVHVVAAWGSPSPVMWPVTVGRTSYCDWQVIITPQ